MTFQHSERALRELFERRRATALGIFAEERNGFFVAGAFRRRGPCTALSWVSRWETMLPLPLLDGRATTGVASHARGCGAGQ